MDYSHYLYLRKEVNTDTLDKEDSRLYSKEEMRGKGCLGLFY